MLRVLQFCRLQRQSRCQHIMLRKYHTEHGVYGNRPQPQRTAFQEPENFIRNRYENANLLRLVTAYREFGHRKADIDPLKLQKLSNLVELEPARYGLSTDSQEKYNLQGILNVGLDQADLKTVIDHLERLYCGTTSVEYSHLLTIEERSWFANRYEEIKSETLADNEKVALAKIMLKSQAFDHFLANKFTTVKRYGGEGAEAAMGFYQELFRLAPKYDINDVIVCIAHRGRLNLLACLMEFPPVVMFRKMQGKKEFPPDAKGVGDVLSHLTSSVDLQNNGDKVHVTMVPNPSHLEAVNPVAVGKTRGRQQTHHAAEYNKEGEYARVGDKALCLQLHGDGAFAGQGIVAETFVLASVPHFNIGGSVHLIINNQIGYTTEASRGRSAMYSSCVAKMNGCPVIHVNGDHPEEVVKACRLALEYRNEFRKDIIVDMLCFRKYGHNELDDPSFTQPVMYDVIKSRNMVPDEYAASVVGNGLCTQEELNEVITSFTNELNKNLSEVDTHVPKANHLEKQWSGYIQAPNCITTWETGLATDTLKFVGSKSVAVPSDFFMHPTLKKTHVDRRLAKLQDGKDLDWATAEALAFGSLLFQGFNVRISGQDVGRGTFSQRHAMLVDQQTDAVYIPLNNIVPEQKGLMEIANSALSEEAVLGFEYGMSVENPRSLVIWEAQFGDFFNGAQIIIDTFITGGETKWLMQSGLVMLLPHGMDGAGPEHSSCRIERFLQLTDSKEDSVDGEDVNIFFTNPTTPAQYYHLLRRQMIRNYRKPLVVAAPKMLLRHPDAVSNLEDMGPGTSFQPILSDPKVDPNKVTRVVFVSGKHYFTLMKEREARKVDNIAFVRLEELCPFPAEQLQAEVKKFKNAKEFIWSQEEHRNSGAWNFVYPRFANIVRIQLKYVGRSVHPTPAAGVGEVHRSEIAQLLADTFS